MDLLKWGKKLYFIFQTVAKEILWTVKEFDSEMVLFLQTRNGYATLFKTITSCEVFDFVFEINVSRLI